MAALALVERVLIGKFTGLWPSSKKVQRQVERNWFDKTQGKISIRFCGKGYFTFHFETKEDKDLIFGIAPISWIQEDYTSINGLQISTLNWTYRELFLFRFGFLTFLFTAGEMNQFELLGML